MGRHWILHEKYRKRKKRIKKKARSGIVQYELYRLEELKVVKCKLIILHSVVKHRYQLAERTTCIVWKLNQCVCVCVCVCVMYCYSRLKSGNCATTPLHCHHVKRACVFFSSVAKVALDVFGRPVFINKRYWLREDSVTVWNTGLA